MKLARLSIENFRGIQQGTIFFRDSTVLIGDNNCGKSTVLEAIDLVLGPERLNRAAVIDEHDFYAGCYVAEDGKSVAIRVEAVVIDLSEEQERHFRNHLEWWDTDSQSFVDEADLTNKTGVLAAIRVCFTGLYDAENDEFKASTCFATPESDDGSHATFSTKDKRLCGFLFLRTLRTGSRALSLERGSLLDIILRLQERRLQMWEDILKELRVLPVAEKEELGITSILSTVQESVRKYIHSDGGAEPHMRVSDLTRETLRKIITVFMATGATLPDGSVYSAPYQHQGTGTVNTLVLALLSQIAELKQNVIFAMEEPEIAIPPHTQKRIVDSIKKDSAQALFTSHSPYVIEEFEPADVLVVKRDRGVLVTQPTNLPPNVRLKMYRQELKRRFCEALLARRVLIVEGRTEYDAIKSASRRLHEVAPLEFRTLEALGVAVVDAESDSKIAPLGKYFKTLGKEVFAICDKQSEASRSAITVEIANLFESPEKGFENLLVKQTKEAALRRFGERLVSEGEWPINLGNPPTSGDSLATVQDCVSKYLRNAKGAGGSADLVGVCQRDEMPIFITESLSRIQQLIDPPAKETAVEETESLLDASI